MSRPIDQNVKREDMGTYVSTVSAKFDNMDEAVAWGENLAQMARLADVEPSRIDEQPKDEQSTESGEIEAPGDSQDVKNDGDTV